MSNDTMIYMMKPILDMIPEIKKPGHNLPFKNKILWTGITLFIYLICCQIPLYGIFMTSSSDPLYYMRVILASNRGTLMELGISPLITSNMVIELWANTKIISFNSNNEQERNLLGKIEKLLSFIVAFATSLFMFGVVFMVIFIILEYIKPFLLYYN